MNIVSEAEGDRPQRILDGGTTMDKYNELPIAVFEYLYDTIGTEIVIEDGKITYVEGGC